jgi:FHS family glucose/mannose:H+ symporter-like MFS transporter
MQGQSSSFSLSTSQRRLSLALHFGFVLIGIINTLLGAVLPALSSSWKMNDSQAGTVFFTQALGAMLGSAASGYLIKKIGVVRLLVTGFILMAASLAGLSFSNRAGGVLMIFSCGLALGLTIPTINLVIALMYRERRAAAVNLLNFAWGVGAAIGPLLVAWLGGKSGIGLPLGVFAALLSTTALFLALCKPVALHSPTSERQGKVSTRWREWLNAYVLLTGVMLFFYVGTETATGGWLASYAKRLNVNADSIWAITQSVFWAGLLIGRAAAPLLLRRDREKYLILFCSFVSLSGIAFILLGETSTTVLIGASFAGLGMSIIFPTTFAVFTERLGEAATEITGLLFVIGSLGGAILPWLVGQASAVYSNLRIGMVVIFLGATLVCVLQAIILIVLRRANR